MAMAVRENQTEDRTRSWVNFQFAAQEIVHPVAPDQSMNLEPASEFVVFKF